MNKKSGDDSFHKYKYSTVECTMINKSMDIDLSEYIASKI